jgi:hypothetical protein
VVAADAFAGLGFCALDFTPDDFIKAVEGQRRGSPKTLEVMVHPGYAEPMPGNRLFSPLSLFALCVFKPLMFF